MKKGQPNKFSEKFKNYHSGMDMEAAWQRLEEKRYPKKKRRGFLYFFRWGAAIFFLIGVGSGFYFYSFSSEKNNLSDDKAANEITNEFLGDIDAKNSIFQNGKRNGNELKINNLSILEKNIKETQTNAETNLISKINSENQLNEVISKRNDDILAKNDNLHNKIFTDSDNENILKESSSSTFNEKLLNSKTANEENPQNEISLETKTIRPDGKTAEGAHFSSLKKLPSRTFFLVEKNKNVLPALLADRLLNLEPQLTSKDFDKKNTLVDDDFPSKYWFGISGGYGKTFRKLEALESSQIDWVSIRNAVELPLDAFYMDLFLEKKITRNFFVITSLGFSQRTDKFFDTYDFEYPEDIDNHLLEVIRFPDGTEELIYGQAVGNAKETTIETRYLRKRFIDLSLLAGYEFLLNRKFGISVAAGGGHAFLLSAKGKTVNANSLGEFRNISELEYRKAGIWQAKTEMNLNYRFSPTIHLQVGLNGRFDLNNLLKTSSGLSEKYVLLGIQGGLKKMF